MSQIATHPAIVISSIQNTVTVEMHVLSACSSCKGHEKCAFVDKADKIVEVDTPDWKLFNPGDKVTVAVNESLGLLAVLLAYFLPALLIIASVVTISIFSNSELIAALIPIILIILYFILLYFLRNRLQRRFTFAISKDN